MSKLTDLLEEHTEEAKFAALEKLLEVLRAELDRNYASGYITNQQMKIGAEAAYCMVSLAVDRERPAHMVTWPDDEE